MLGPSRSGSTHPPTSVPTTCPAACLSFQTSAMTETVSCQAQFWASRGLGGKRSRWALPGHVSQFLICNEGCKRSVCVCGGGGPETEAQRSPGICPLLPDPLLSTPHLPGPGTELGPRRAPGWPLCQSLQQLPTAQSLRDRGTQCLPPPVPGSQASHSIPSVPSARQGGGRYLGDIGHHSGNGSRQLCARPLPGPGSLAPGKAEPRAPPGGRTVTGKQARPRKGVTQNVLEAHCLPSSSSRRRRRRRRLRLLQPPGPAGPSTHAPHHLSGPHFYNSLPAPASAQKPAPLPPSPSLTPPPLFLPLTAHHVPQKHSTAQTMLGSHGVPTGGPMSGVLPGPVELTVFPPHPAGLGLCQGSR